MRSSALEQSIQEFEQWKHHRYIQDRWRKSNEDARIEEAARANLIIHNVTGQVEDQDINDAIAEYRSGAEYRRAIR